MGALPFSGNLGSLFGGMGPSESRVMFDPKEFVAWTGLGYVSDTDRADRGWLVVNGKTVATVRSSQIGYKEALSYDMCVDDAHVILFKGADDVRDGVVSIVVGSVANLALLTAQGNLPDQVVISSSFTFSEHKLPKLTKEFKRCGYDLLHDNGGFRGDQSDWTYGVVDEENSVVVGFIKGGRKGHSDDDSEITGIAQLFRSMERAQSRATDGESLKLNITTTDVVLIEALIDVLGENSFSREEHA
jgi:hypothetical protein